MSSPQKLAIVLGAVLLLSSGYYYYSSRAGTEIALTLTTNPDLERGLVGHWTFDGNDVDWSNTSAEIRDRSGNDVQGDVFEGDVDVIPGPLGQALYFNNSAWNAVGLESCSNLEMDVNDMTVASWILVPEQALVDNDEFQIFSTKSSWTSAGVDVGFDTFLGSHITAHVCTDALDCTIYSSVLDIVDSGWHHVTVVLDRDAGALFYVDGLFTESDGTSIYNGSDITSSDCALHGVDGYGYENGLDDVRVYDRALSAEEVKRLYQLGATTKVAQTITTNPDLERGLVGHWTFDGQDVDWSSTTAEIRDRSGSGNHANADTLSTGNVVPGPVGQGMYFNAVGDSDIDACVTDTPGNDFDFADGEKFTLAGWFMPVDLLANQYYIVKQMVWYEGYALNFDNYIWRFLVSNGVDDQVVSLEYSLPSTTPEWHHIVAVWGDTYAELYVDGVLVDSQYSGLEEATSLATDGDFCIGSRHHEYRPARGYMDDIRVYNRALSADEAKRLYQLGATTKVAQTITTNPDLERGLVGHWTFDGPDVDWSSTTAEIRDRSGNNRHGDADASMTTRSVTPGPLGQAMSFDGVDDRVTSVAPPYSSSFTVSAWVRSPNAPTASQDTDVLRWRDSNAIIHWDSTTTGVDGSIEFMAVGGGRKRVYYGTIVPNEWHHIVGTYDYGDTYRLSAYTNGELTDYVDVEESHWTPDDDSNIFTIGSDYSYDWYFSGDIDDVRIYNRALSADEVARLYALGGGTPTPSYSSPGSSITYLGYTEIADSDGNQSQSVTVPDGADFALAFIGGWRSGTNPAVTSISLGGTAMTSVGSSISDSEGAGYMYYATTSAGSKTFASTQDNTWTEGGKAVLLFFSGVDQSSPIRDSEAQNAPSFVTLSFNGLTSVAGDMAVLQMQGYVSDNVDVDLSSQTKIFENTTAFNSDYNAAAYKTASGSTIDLSCYGDYPSAVVAVLKPAP